MTRTVHYMIRKPMAPGEVIYPSELDVREDYYGVGSFFLGGQHECGVDEIYSFWAIRELRAVETKLVQRTSDVFRATVDGVGQFHFKAKKLGNPARYTGQHPGFADGRLIRQLAPFDHDALDAAVWLHDFFFVGFTPNLDVGR